MPKPRIKARKFYERIEKMTVPELLAELAKINKRLGDPPLMMVQLRSQARKKA